MANLSGRPRRVAVYPYFPIGYMSWMNQSAEYRADLGGIVGSCVTPYQKATEYFKNKYFKDRTYFLCETPPVSWDARQLAFEGEGGLHAPSAVAAPELSGSDARYETPTAAVQYRETLAAAGAGDAREYRFMFGPAFDDAEIRELRARHLSRAGFEAAAREYAAYVARGSGVLRISTPDPDLGQLRQQLAAAPGLLPRRRDRLTTDPQTAQLHAGQHGHELHQPGRGPPRLRDGAVAAGAQRRHAPTAS